MLNFVIFLNAFYAFIKTQNIIPLKKRIILVFAINIGVSMIYALLIVNLQSAVFQILSYVGIALSLSFLKCAEKNKSIIIGLMCACYAHVLKLGSYYLSTVIIYSFFGPVFNLMPYVLTSVVSVVFNTLILRIKRLRNGIRFLEKKENLGIQGSFSAAALYKFKSKTAKVIINILY